MLVKLPEGKSVNPDIVRLVNIKADKSMVDGKPAMRYVVYVRLDDGMEMSIQSLNTPEEAIAAAELCTNRINKALGSEDPNDAEGESPPDDSDGADNSEDETEPDGEESSSSEGVEDDGFVLSPD